MPRTKAPYPPEFRDQIVALHPEDPVQLRGGFGAADFIRSRSGVVGQGDLPHNTGGGQLSSDQADYSGGYLGLVEALRQLIGRPTGRQIEHASLGLVSGCCSSHSCKHAHFLSRQCAMVHLLGNAGCGPARHRPCQDRVTVVDERISPSHSVLVARRTTG